MAALFHDVSPVQYYDEVRIPDGGETVGDDDAGTSLHHLPHGVLYGLLRTGIYVRGSFVKDQDPGIRHEGPGDGQQLALALADVLTGSGQHSVIALG